jgi:putative SOS response-associated peptidase YedK
MRRPVRSLDVMRWGLVPFWAKDIKVGFREAFQRRRCLVPVDR